MMKNSRCQRISRSCVDASLVQKSLDEEAKEGKLSHTWGLEGERVLRCCQDSREEEASTARGPEEKLRL